MSGKWTFAALVLAVTVSAPSTAMAAITDARATPTALAQAMSVTPATVTSASYPSIAPALGMPAGLSDVPLATFPRVGPTYAILSTGDASFADDANASGSLDGELGYTSAVSAPDAPNRGAGTHDPVTLLTNINVPANTNCLIVRFRFLSEEFPEFVGSQFNDAFVAELDSTTWSTAAGGAITSPNNFAFDQNNNPVTINATGASTVSSANAAGTTYDAATRRLAAAKLVTPGVHKLYLSVFDVGDDQYDSAVFLDGLDYVNVDPAKCTGGAFQDDVPPALTSGNPSAAPEALVSNGQFTKDDTPTFGGKGGQGLNDLPSVTGNLFPATVSRATPIVGTPLQSKTVGLAADGSWTITADPLAEGSYVFQASQGATNGETAFSDPIAFVIDKTAPKLTTTPTLYGGKTRDNTPLLGGAAGAAAGDAAAVNVRLFGGPAASGSPLLTLGVLRSAAAWSLQTTTRLKDGVYTVAADQTDAAGNVASAPLTFRVTTSNPIGKVKFPKRLRRAAAARKVAGSMRFAFPGKVTFRLSATIGRKTYSIGSVTRTLRSPGVARFSLKPSRSVARRIRRGRGVIALRTTFVDDQRRTYRKTQRVGFR
jgi:hypothetical protein